MTWTILNRIRNFLFDIFLADIFKALISFRVLDIRKEQLLQNNTYNPEEIEQQAQNEAQKCTRSIIKRIIFIATKQHLINTYTSSFIEYYNIAIAAEQKAWKKYQ